MISAPHFLSSQPGGFVEAWMLLVFLFLTPPVRAEAQGSRAFLPPLDTRCSGVASGSAAEPSLKLPAAAGAACRSGMNIAGRALGVAARPAFAAKSPRMTGEFCGQTPAAQQRGTGL